MDLRRADIEPQPLVDGAEATAVLDRAVPQKVGRERPLGRIAQQALGDHLHAGKDERRDMALVAAAQASRSGPCGSRPCPGGFRARASGTSSSSASILASSQCEASNLSVSAGPSTHRLSLLSARNGSQSISGAALHQPAAGFHQQARARRRWRPRARARGWPDALRARPPDNGR